MKHISNSGLPGSFWITVIAITASVVFVSPAKSYDDRMALVNFADDLISCAAFYSIWSAAAKTSGKDFRQFDKAYEIAISRAADIIRRETITAKFGLEMDTQMQMIFRNFENISILTAKYGALCKLVIEDPGKRIEYWRQKR